MADTVDLELVELIQNFLEQQREEGANMPGFIRNIDFDYEVIGRALMYMEDNGEVYRSGNAFPTWYLKK